MESLDEFLKKIDFDQDAVFYTEDGKLKASIWDKNAQYCIAGIFNSPFPIEKFTLPPSVLAGALSFATDISVEQNVLKIHSLEVNGTINLHENVGRVGVPNIEYEDETSFIIKSDMLGKIKRAQKTYSSNNLEISAKEGDFYYINVIGDADQKLSFKINTPATKNINTLLSNAFYTILDKVSGYDLRVWVLDGKPAKFGLASPAFSVFYYVMNQ